jgi:tetratricopeptide (TPR) repeat protein
MWRVWWSRPRSVAEHTAAVLHRQVGDQSSIALNHVGRVPFFTGYHTYDTLGLCSAELLPLSRDSLGAVLEFIDEAEVEILALAEWEMTSLGSYSDLTHRYEFLTSTLGWRFMRRLPDSQPPRRSLAVPDGPFAGLEPWDRWLMMARLDDIRERDGEEAWLAAIPKLLDYFPASVPLMRDLSTKLAHARHWDQACSTLERGTEVLELEAAEQPFNAGLMLVLSDWHSHMAVGAPDVAEQRRLYARSLEYAHLAEQREPLSDAVANRIQTVSRRLAFVEAKSAGEELFNAEQWEAACESMRLAVSLAPRDAEAQEMLGVAAQRLGEISEARIAWSRAVSRTTGEESEGVWEKGFAELASMGVSPEEALRVGCASAAQCQQAARWLEERADSSSAWAVRELVTELSR